MRFQKPGWRSNQSASCQVRKTDACRNDVLNDADICNPAFSVELFKIAESSRSSFNRNVRGRIAAQQALCLEMRFVWYKI